MVKNTPVLFNMILYAFGTKLAKIIPKDFSSSKPKNDLSVHDLHHGENRHHSLKCQNLSTVIFKHAVGVLLVLVSYSMTYRFGPCTS